MQGKDSSSQRDIQCKRLLRNLSKFLKDRLYSEHLLLLFYKFLADIIEHFGSYRYKNSQQDKENMS